MDNIKEVIFFTRGDSSKVSTWSNVPYLFCKTLEEKGIRVIRININHSPILSFIWNKTIYKCLNIIFKGNKYEAIRTKWYNLFSDRIIKKSITNNPNADLCIFTTFSFYNKYNNIPTVQIGDWTYDILIRERLNRKPFYFESWFINKEYNAIKNSNLVISLFPECRDSILKSIPNCNIKWGKMNVVNTLYEGEIDYKSVIIKKSTSNKLLFIGRKHYIEGANLLIKSFIELKKKYPLLELHIIGLTTKDFKTLPKDIYCYGFLRKENIEERNLYYSLILDSKIFINPNPIWGGYSSTIETMFYYTPIIISPYKDFVSEFGYNIDFGLYNEEFSTQSLTNKINIILSLDKSQYINMCNYAHEKVKNYTWSNYVNWIFNELSKSHE